MDQHTDVQLVRSYRAGEKGAFAEILNRHHRRMQAVARRYARREEDVQDILQDAYLRASQGLDGFRAEARLSTWLHRLVANSALDHIGRARNRVETPVLDEDAHRRLGMRHDPMHRAELRMAVRRALKEVTPGQAAAVVLVDVAGYSVADAAALLGVAPGTVKSRAWRARERLREVLDPALARDDSTAARPGQLVA